MKINQQLIVKRWKPILEEYEKIQNKVLPRSFRLVKDLCLAHHISNSSYHRSDKKTITKRYEKVTPGELAHIDLTKVPKDIRTVFKIKDLYVAALEDDCTRLTYLKILKDKRASTLTYFMARALSWFKQIYNFEFEKLLSDNGLRI